MKEPVDHILRPALPWRASSGMTECGYDASKVSVLTREEFFARFKEWGQQRTSLHTCMTCSDTARRWGTWSDDPRRAVEREIQWETAWHRTDRGQRLRDEMVAIAALVEAHREEFDAHIAATEQRRDWLERKAANEASRRSKPRERGL